MDDDFETRRRLIGQRKSIDDSIRGWADVLALWRLCREAKCMRAHACCGEPRRCFRAHVPLLPESLQVWFDTISAAQQDGASFDEAIDDTLGTIAEDALQRWHIAIAMSDLAARSVTSEDTSNHV
jgi:hypothetical protein